MRKNFFLGFGLFLIFGAVVSLGFASSYQYHLYQYQNSYYNDHRHTSTYRPATVRLSPWNYRYNKNKANDCAQYLNCDTSRLSHPSGRSNAYKYLSPLRTPTPYNNRYSREAYYLTHPGFYPRYENTFQSDRLVVQNGDYKDRTVEYRGTPKISDSEIADETNYIIDTDGFTRDKDGVYRVSGTSLAFRVTTTPENYKCAQSNFWACANQLNRNFKTDQNLKNVTNQNIASRWNQTQDLDLRYYPTVTESFKARLGSRENEYFLFNVLNPVDGSIVRIEAVAYARDHEESTRAMYQIFESFRFVNYTKL